MRSKGFTLIELLVAISIIAVLTAVLLPNFMGARERARDAQKKQDLYAIKNALRLYYNDHQSYPITVGQNPDLGGTGVTTLLGNYLPNAAGVGFTYMQTNNGDGFQLCAQMEAPQGSDTIESQRNCGVGESVCNAAIGISSVYVVCAN
jgi:prepilin-type N-terminal cleavage/methylation domain-containing protein